MGVKTKASNLSCQTDYTVAPYQEKHQISTTHGTIHDISTI